MTLVRCAAMALVACGFVATASGQPSETKQFSVPGHGSLVLGVPKGWRVAERPLEKPASTALRIGPPSGDGFLLQVSVLWLEPGNRAGYNPQAVKARVQKTADDLLSRAVEKEATVTELRGKAALGHQFSLTDRSSTNGPGDYKYVTQGMLVTGELVTVFTLLHRDPAAREKAQVLQMLAEARHSSEAPPPRADALQIRDLAQGYELSVPASRLVMTIPKSAMPRATREPSPNGHPRYFYFVDGLLNVSGWFEPATEFAGIRSFWERETATWRKKGLPPPVETSFARIGKWDAVLYDVASPAGTNSHIRAHWVQAGTWIDVHLSVTTDRPSAENRSRLTELLKTIAVREKG